MFNLFQTSIPAREWKRAKLAKSLLIDRCNLDVEFHREAIKLGIDFTQISGEDLMLGAPEASIIRIVEQYLTLREQGAIEEEAVEFMLMAHSAALSGYNPDLPPILGRKSLLAYVSQFIKTIHPDGFPMQRDFLIHAISKIKDFYKRSHID